tara:strand:+ start:395 stop:1324 length:930 start_codon:yes stop_codon:yes gene_type:complete
MLKAGLFNGGAQVSSASSAKLDLNHKTFNNSTHPLVAWYDFTDVATIDRDQVGTAIGASGHPIGRIRNKSNPQPGATYKIGIHLNQTTSGSKPAWTSDGTIAGSYAKFDGTDDHLEANDGVGNVDTNKLTDTKLNANNMTVFWVCKPDVATLSSNETVFVIVDGGKDIVSAYVENTDNQWNANASDAAARSNTIIDTGVASTTATQTWLLELNCDVSGGTSDMFKNGLVVGEKDGNGDAMELDLTVNHAAVQFIIGCSVPTSDSGAQKEKFWDGGISEVIIFDGLLSADTRANVVNYLLTKYNIPVLTS